MEARRGSMVKRRGEFLVFVHDCLCGLNAEKREVRVGSNEESVVVSVGVPRRNNHPVAEDADGYVKRLVNQTEFNNPFDGMNTVRAFKCKTLEAATHGEETEVGCKGSDGRISKEKFNIYAARHWKNLEKVWR